MKEKAAKLPKDTKKETYIGEIFNAKFKTPGPGKYNLRLTK